ncbi:MAG: GGDEF domain-containing protein [Muricomes sp.]
MHCFPKYYSGKQTARKPQRQATVDALTGVYNRGTFFERVRDSLDEGKAKTPGHALLMFDLDHFKQVNDTYGHPCGDAVLQAVADVIRQHFRKGDIVGRYGGEEFAVLLANISDTQAVAAAEKVREAIEGMEIHCGDQSVRVTISIGVAHHPNGDSQTLESLLAQADEALYLSKSRGRNQTSLYIAKEAVT